MKRILVIVAVEAERVALGARCLAAPEVRVVVAGIGRTNAAAATAEALTEARATGAPFAAVISTGIAGALPGSNLSIGTVIVADACIYAEEGIALPEGQGDMRVLGFPLGDFEGNRVPVDGALLVAFRALGPAWRLPPWPRALARTRRRCPFAHVPARWLKRWKERRWCMPRGAWVCRQSRFVRSATPLAIEQRSGGTSRLHSPHCSALATRW